MPMPQQVTSSSVHVGCSGWQYRHWRGDFYPAELPQARWLEYYASKFDTVEINNTFYRLPEAPTFTAWRQRVPARFIFAVKASRFLTHMKKLKDPAEPLERLFSRARNLGPSLGPVLYQLPPHWTLDLDRFQIFLRELPKRRRHVFEFRETSWYSEEVFALLEKHGATLCLHDMAGSATGKLAIGPFVYVRFHGTTKYAGSYADETLNGWADWMAERVEKGCAIYAYFNNDTGGHAPRDAVRLRDALAKRIHKGSRGSNL
jgi:uncharacterized protein YecE (DUF72 family)